MHLRVWLDYACPFCYIGHGLVERFRESFPGVPVEWKGFELHPEVRPEGDELARIVPHAADRERVRAWLTRVAESAGVPAPPQVPATVPNTRRAHVGAAWVRAHAPDARDAYHARVLAAYWEDGLNLGEPDVLVAAARAAGVRDVDAFAAAVGGPFPEAAHRQEAEANGVTGVPTFDVLGAGLKRRIVGAQPFDVIAQTTRLVLDAEPEVEA